MKARRIAANVAKLPELERERYCGQLQSYQYQPLVQYTQV
jgi:hypothetical protein